MADLLSEKELIDAITDRDPLAAGILYDQYAAKLFKVICCSVRDIEKAEFVLQKTMHTIWHNMGEHTRQNKHLLLWMAGIARNMARQSASSLSA